MDLFLEGKGMEWSSVINYIISLIVICNPLSALPAFLMLTQGHSLAGRRETGIVSGIAVAVILIVSTWMGQPLLEFLGIRVGAFQLAGGLVLLLLALSMLKTEYTGIQESSNGTIIQSSVAVVPLAIPLMAGPGAISSVIVTANTHPGVVSHLYMTVGGLIVALFLGTILYFAGALERILGRTGINVFNRIGGLILAAMATETIIRGAASLFPLLAG